MSDKNSGVLLVAAAVAVYLIAKKQQQTTAAARPGVTPSASKNVNGDMWARLLGTGWQNLLGSAANKGSANGQPFVMSDGYGGLFTSDGTPVGTGDPIANWMAKDTGLAPVYDNSASYGTGAWVSGQNPAVDAASGWATQGGYWDTSPGVGGLSSVLDMFGGAAP